MTVPSRTRQSLKDLWLTPIASVFLSSPNSSVARSETARTEAGPRVPRAGTVSRGPVRQLPGG